MGTKQTHIAWKTVEEQILREKWSTDETVKSFLHLLSPGRTYQSVISHAAYLRLGPRPTKVRSKYSAVWDEVRRLLERGLQLTTKEICVRTGFCDRHVSDLLRSRLNAEEPEIHVVAWRRRGKGYGHIEVWALGDGPNAPRPKAVSNDEMNRRRRARRAARKVASVSGPFSVAMLQVMGEAA
jgi:hypothetical protein